MRRIGNSKICPILSAKIMSQSKEELPVIVQLKNKNTKLADGIMGMAIQKKSNLPLINGIACSLTSEMIYRLSTNSEIEYISFDSKIFTQMDIAGPSIDVSFPHNQGFQGEGVTIAVIDTGISPHQDLTRPNNRIIGFKDFVNNKKDPYDDNGHGTHVAGIIAGNGFSSRGRYKGIAPKSNILALKALDHQGGGNSSNVIAALSYIVETKEKYNTKIVNLSVGSPANNYCQNDPLCKAVSEANKKGLIVIVAGGNNGPSEKTILSPGISPNAITVGAVDDKGTINPADDVIADFSSRGPTIEGLVKPDLVAPGVSIKSLSHNKLDSYNSLSGTSMATPVVSGSAALLLNKDSSLSPLEIKRKLTGTCRDLNVSKDIQGAGMINLEKLFFDDSKKKKDNIKSEKESSASHKDSNLEIFIILIFVLLLLDKNI